MVSTTTTIGIIIIITTINTTRIQELQASNEALCICTKFLDESSMAVDLGQRL
jgi:hypothetical protein